MNSEKKYKALIFDLDNTLYPEKDYLFQVYYMIGQFIEYQETYDHEIITKFLIDEFNLNGRKNLFNKLIEKFELNESYLENFSRLLRTARLPLKLLLFQSMLARLKAAIDDGKLIFILTNGNPEQQLNKIRQIEWNGLEQHIKCYFCNEIASKPAPDAMLKLLNDHQLQKEDVLFIGDAQIDADCASAAGVEFEWVKHVETSPNF